MELLLERCGFGGVCLLLSVTEADLCVALGLRKATLLVSGKAGFRGSSAIIPLSSGDTRDFCTSLSGHGAVDGAFCSVLSLMMVSQPEPAVCGHFAMLPRMTQAI